MQNSSFLFLLYLAMIASACEGTSEFSAGIDNQTDVLVQQLDTFTIYTSTFRPDSVITSGQNRMLVGRRIDVSTGALKAQTYFKIAPGSNRLPDMGAEFLSLTLHLDYNYYQGDTNQIQTIKAHEVTEEIALAENQTHFYTFSHFDYNPNPLGELSFMAQPNGGKALEIPLLASLGQDWLERIKNEEDIFDEAEDFVDFFAGLTLTAGPSDNACLLGFSLDADKSFLRLKYREGLEEYDYDFALYDSRLQFNHIDWENQSTDLAGLLPNQTLASTSTQNQTFLMGGVGLATQLVFPSIGSLAEYFQPTQIQYAELSIVPVGGTYRRELFPLPPDLILYETNERNEIIRAITHFSGARVIPTLTVDNEFQENTAYSFPITDFVIELSEREIIEPTYLLVTLPNANGAERLVLGDAELSSFKLRLKVIVTQFEP
ncbi:MAG: hypothetical protein OHK0053_01330 [Microscillaceae bacterium]